MAGTIKELRQQNKAKRQQRRANRRNKGYVTPELERLPDDFFVNLEKPVFMPERLPVATFEPVDIILGDRSRVVRPKKPVQPAPKGNPDWDDRWGNGPRRRTGYTKYDKLEDYEHRARIADQIYKSAMAQQVAIAELEARPGAIRVQPEAWDIIGGAPSWGYDEPTGYNPSPEYERANRFANEQRLAAQAARERANAIAQQVYQRKWTPVRDHSGDYYGPGQAAPLVYYDDVNAASPGSDVRGFYRRGGKFPIFRYIS